MQRRLSDMDGDGSSWWVPMRMGVIGCFFPSICGVGMLLGGGKAKGVRGCGSTLGLMVDDVAVAVAAFLARVKNIFHCSIVPSVLYLTILRKL